MWKCGNVLYVNSIAAPRRCDPLDGVRNRFNLTGSRGIESITLEVIGVDSRLSFSFDPIWMKREAVKLIVCDTMRVLKFAAHNCPSASCFEFQLSSMGNCWLPQEASYDDDGTSASVTSGNVCELQNDLSYCICDDTAPQRALTIRCQIIDVASQTDVFWTTFRTQTHLSGSLLPLIYSRRHWLSSSRHHLSRAGRISLFHLISIFESFFSWIQWLIRWLIGFHWNDSIAGKFRSQSTW